MLDVPVNTGRAGERATCDTGAGIRGSAAERVSLRVGCRPGQTARRPDSLCVHEHAAMCYVHFYVGVRNMFFATAKTIQVYL